MPPSFLRSIGRGKSTALVLAAAALLVAGLACSRSDVPLPTSTPQEPIEETPEASPTSEPTSTVTPTPLPTNTPSAPEPVVSPTFPPTPTSDVDRSENILYVAQSGDTVRTVAVRFGVLPSEISSSEGLLPEETRLIDPGRILIIPRRLGLTGPSEQLIPDSELVFSPHAVDFNIESFVEAQAGYLTRYHETVGGRRLSGAGVIGQVARDNSVNPRILLALLEYHSGWVTDPTIPTGDDFSFPIGHIAPDAMGLFRQLTWLSNELGNGYYGWRSGSLTELHFEDGSLVRLAPDLNAGTVALQHYFATRLQPREWAETISPQGFIQLYRDFFGDPFDYTHPLYEAGLEQPDLILPFLPNHIWAFTGGPHGAWERESAWAALDFAPSSSLPGCVDSEDWVVASAPGLVVRSEAGIVVLDLDGDGREQTGWNILYLHIESDGRVRAGELVETGDLLGHPSCEGGIATGTHLHIARKYNGEWILADGAVPFNLSGWVAVGGAKSYQGKLVNGDQEVLACTCASRETYISR